MRIDQRRTRPASESIIKFCVATAAAAGSVMLAWGVKAGDWTLTDTFATDLTYVDRSGGNSSNGIVVDVRPGISIAGQSGRSQGYLDYELTASLGTNDTDPRRLAHSLRADGRVEVIENTFFLGGRANARLVGDNASSGFVDVINAGIDGQQTYSFELIPEFRHHLNRYADIVSTNAIDYVTYAGGSNNDDSSAYRANLGIQSGRYFGPVNWGFDAVQEKTMFDDRDDERNFYSASLGYRFDSTLRVRGAVGYEENDVLTSRDDDTDGEFWDVGFDWNPTPRTSVNATYGSRYHGPAYSGGIRHRMRRTQMSLDFSRAIANRRASQLSDSFFGLVDADSGNFVTDPGTGEAVQVDNPNLEQTDEDYLNTQVRAAILVTGRRTTAALTGSISNRKYEVSNVDEDSRSLSLSLSRQLGDGVTGLFSTRLQKAEDTLSGDSDTFDVRFGLSKQLSAKTSVSLDFLHRKRDGSSGSSNDDYTENRIGISLATSFL